MERIVAVGDHLTGGSYEFLDASPSARRAVHYFIEDIDIYGYATRHEPVRVQTFGDARHGHEVDIRVRGAQL